ncbi:MAG: peptidoglycan DD-metalloendopeptidase family protein, partial [Clostridia bacterium]|nr:peptidoglycan DD-metalloendopeptidase family protein [Clostridia bacterium]
MKNARALLIATIVISVFLLSFLIGRATALRSKEENSSENKIYMGTVTIPKKEEKEETAPAAAGAKVLEENKEEETAKPQKKPETKESVPSRLPFPCGQTVLKGYSETAVYSETMGDWRAHTGIDYAAEKGSEVQSVWDGTVTRVYKDKLWGSCVEITHSEDLKSVYKNLASKIPVKKGDKV